MGQTLILIGVGCMIAAIVGGGIKLQQLEVGAVPSLWRQGLLGVFGFLVSAFGFGVAQDYFKAAPGSETPVAAASTNTAVALPTSPPAASTAGPASANAGQSPAGNAPKHQAPAKTAANEQAALTMRDQNGLPVVDVSGVWVDETGHRLRFTQTGATVSINGGDESGSAGPWSGAGNLYRQSRIQLDLMAGPSVREFCRGPTYKTSMTLMCENPGTGGDVRHTTLKRVG